VNQLQKAKVEEKKSQSEKRNGVTQTAERSSAKKFVEKDCREIAAEQGHFHEEFNKPSIQPSRGSDTTSLGFPIRCRKIFQAIRGH